MCVCVCMCVWVGVPFKYFNLTQFEWNNNNNNCLSPIIRQLTILSLNIYIQLINYLSKSCYKHYTSINPCVFTQVCVNSDQQSFIYSIFYMKVIKTSIYVSLFLTIISITEINIYQVEVVLSHIRWRSPLSYQVGESSLISGGDSPPSYPVGQSSHICLRLLK